MSARFLAARAERGFVAKGLPSALRNPKTLQRIVSSGTPASSYALAASGADAAGKKIARSVSSSPGWRALPRADKNYNPAVRVARGNKISGIYGAKARIPGSPENVAARAPRTPSPDVAKPPVPRKKQAVAWGSWEKTPSRGSRENIINPRGKWA